MSGGGGVIEKMEYGTEGQNWCEGGGSGAVVRGMGLGREREGKQYENGVIKREEGLSRRTKRKREWGEMRDEMRERGRQVGRGSWRQ